MLFKKLVRAVFAVYYHICAFIMGMYYKYQDYRQYQKDLEYEKNGTTPEGYKRGKWIQCKDISEEKLFNLLNNEYFAIKKSRSLFDAIHSFHVVLSYQEGMKMYNRGYIIDKQIEKLNKMYCKS